MEEGAPGSSQPWPEIFDLSILRSKVRVSSSLNTKDNSITSIYREDMCCMMNVEKMRRQLCNSRVDCKLVNQLPDRSGPVGLGGYLFPSWKGLACELMSSLVVT
jgi:hypothetical protein